MTADHPIDKKQTSSRAMLALFLAGTGIFLFFPMPIAIVLGHFGRLDCKTNQKLRGKWMATLALFIGYAYFSIAIGFALVFLFVPVGP